MLAGQTFIIFIIVVFQIQLRIKLWMVGELLKKQ